MTWRPTLTLLLLAPVLGEVLSSATSPLEFLLPWNLALFVALYGCGALLCRETAFRWELGLPGLALLGAAYGVYEEALVDRFWFDPSFARETGIGDYAEVGGTNVLLATHLTLFHSAVSICSSILLVTWLFPEQRGRAWLSGRTTVAVGIGPLLALGVTFESFVPPPPGPTAVAVAVLLLLVLLGSAAPRGRGRPLLTLPATPGTGAANRTGGRWLGPVAFAATGAHFVLVYAVPATGLVWPAGLALALVPIALAGLLVRRRAVTGPLGADGVRVVSGVLGFFLLLDAGIGLGGRYDLTVAAGLLTLALVRLRRRWLAAEPSRPRTGAGAGAEK
jgi:hypothetical protein